MRRRGRIVLAGSVAQKPRHGGHTWVFLQYLLGFRRLGWEVLFVDRLEPEMCRDEQGQPCSVADSFNARFLFDVARRFAIEDSVALLYGDTCLGLDRRQVKARLREADLLINVMGFLRDEELLEAARRRVFLDIDPGFTQMWQALGLADVLRGHDAFVTIGERIGRSDCTIPECGLAWIPTRPPVVMEHWPAAPAAAEPFTSIGTWRGRYAPVDFAGETYGLRVHAFRHLAALPRTTQARFELALDIDAADQADIELLRANGWTLVSPLVAASDPWSYRDYIAGSGAEFMVAKDIYVRSRSGWFSDRSVCYLASGRPVVAQDTGIGELYATGEGLLAYRGLTEAHDAVERVRAEPQRHSRAARRIAAEVFDSDKVLGRLLDRLGAAA